MILALDCDLRTSYGVTDTGWSGRAADPVEVVHACKAVMPPSIILFEIASPVSFNRGADGQAAMTMLAKWAIWNTAWAALLASDCSLRRIEFLVAPSNVWTKGHPEKVRHLIADCKQPKKDLRECEAMLFFHRHHPGDWKPLLQYLSEF